MHDSLPGRPSPALACSLAAVATGLAIETLLEPTLATAPALLLVALGLAGVASRFAEHPAGRLRRTVRRWWLFAVVAFLPYGLATSPSTESAAAVGDALSGPAAGAALEVVAGAAILSAVTVTVLFGFASYGIHPGTPAPEERVLDD